MKAAVTKTLHSRSKAFALATAAIAPVVLLGRARAATFAFKYGHNLPTDSPLHVRTTQMWEAVKRETGGSLDVRVYANSTLGGDTSMLGQLRSGALEFMTISGPILSDVVPVSAIENIPFAFKTASQAYAAADGAMGEYVRGEIAARGIQVFAKPFEIGFYQLTNSVRPIRTVDDLTGLKMRTGNSKLAVDTFRSMGSSATPMNLSEVYTSLQTHVVDGQYNSYATIEVTKFYEVQRYLSEVNFAWGNYWLLANKQTWDSLGPDIQRVVVKNTAIYSGLQRRDNELLSAASGEKLVRQGMTRNVADPATFRAKLAGGFYQRWRDEFGPRAWALLERYSGKLT